MQMYKLTYIAKQFQASRLIDGRPVSSLQHICIMKRSRKNLETIYCCVSPAQFFPSSLSSIFRCPRDKLHQLGILSDFVFYRDFATFSFFWPITIAIETSMPRTKQDVQLSKSVCSPTFEYTLLAYLLTWPDNQFSQER